MAKKIITAESVARGLIVSEAVRQIGVKQGSHLHKRIIDDFNRVKPDGSPMTYNAPRLYGLRYAAVLVSRRLFK